MPNKNNSINLAVVDEMVACSLMLSLFATATLAGYLDSYRIGIAWLGFSGTMLCLGTVAWHLLLGYHARTWLAAFAAPLAAQATAIIVAIAAMQLISGTAWRFFAAIVACGALALVVAAFLRLQASGATQDDMNHDTG